MQSGIVGVLLKSLKNFGSPLGVVYVFVKEFGCCFGGEVDFTEEEQECGNANKQEERQET